MPPPKRRPPLSTMLLDMYQTMGKIEAQNDLILAEQARAAQARERLLKGQSELSHRMDDLDGGEAERYEGGYKPQLKDMATLKKQLATAGLIAWGALTIIWYALLNIKDIYEFLRDTLHWK